MIFRRGQTVKSTVTGDVAQVVADSTADGHTYVEFISGAEGRLNVPTELLALIPPYDFKPTKPFGRGGSNERP